MEAAERSLFENGVRHATEAASGAALDAALQDLGWRDALGADRRAAVSVLFECQGAAHATSAALDWLMSATLGASADCVVVLPPLRHCGAPGRRDGERLVVQGLGTAAFDRSETALVATENAGGVAAFVVPTRQLETRLVHGLDPALGLAEVTGEFDAAAATRLETVDWAAAVAVGQLAVGHELVGAGRAVLELARVHALERIQFGRPIGTFQAVRHRLSESLVALEAAAALLDGAWDDPSPVTAAMAKSFAGRSARTVSRHCQQVLAGIGFTTEHPLHLFIRRTIVLDQLLGAGNVLTSRLGADILRSGSLPAAFPL